MSTRPRWAPATSLPGDIASLATVVLDLAGRQDPAAKEVVAEAARELALHVETVVRQLRLKKPPVALGGGLMMRSALRRALVDALKTEIGPVNQVVDPPLGAVVLAKRLHASGPARR
jgi:N-acetylglucosamine kinase-like BadF-type ATPase